ncbi:flagellar basal body protein [bacterium]|nr:flagellar basal body protein [bacterium]
MLRETSSAALQSAMKGTQQRLEAIADNLANAETPGHGRLQVDFEDALHEAIRKEHSEGVGTAAGSETEGAVDRVQAQVTRRPARSSDATTADPEGDLTALGETTLRFDALARALTKKLRMLRTAIAGGGQG